MKNKSLLVKFGLLGFALCSFGVSSVWATTFTLDMEGIYSLGSQISRSIVPIHFVDNGNDFGGFIYFSDDFVETEDSLGVTEGGPFYVKLNDECDENDELCEKECSTQVKGLYYNAERGDRLWPLDELTKKKQQGIQSLGGGIYTDCRKVGYHEALSQCQTDDEMFDEQSGEPASSELNDDLKSCVAEVDNNYPKDNAYYGMVTWKMEPQYGGETFSLLLGIKYATEMINSWRKPVNPLEFSSNFVNIGSPSTTKVGFLYDNNGGIGFAGCEITGSNLKENTLGQLLEHQGNLYEVFDYDYDFVEGKSKLSYKYNEESAFLNCDNIGQAGDSLMKLIIEGLVGVNRETDIGVKGNQIDSKMQYFSSSDINSATLLNFAKQRAEILCRGKRKNVYNEADRKNPNINIVCLSGVNVSIADADIIKSEIRKSDGTLIKPRQTLIVNNGTVTVRPFTDKDDTSYYDIFINNGVLYINESNPAGTNKFVFKKQGFISENSISQFVSNVAVSPENYNSDDVAVGVFLRGNFIVDGNVKSSNELYFGKLWNKYFIYGKFSSKDSFEELEDLFAWRCSNGYVKDFQNSSSFASPSVRGYCPPSVYENAALVVIDQNYNSPLYW